MCRRVGAMFAKDADKALLLPHCLRMVIHQGVLQRRVRRGRRHAQQRFCKLALDTHQFLQFGEVHVLEIADFHDEILTIGCVRDFRAHR